MMAKSPFRPGKGKEIIGFEKRKKSGGINSITSQGMLRNKRSTRGPKGDRRGGLFSAGGAIRGETATKELGVRGRDLG